MIVDGSAATRALGLASAELEPLVAETGEFAARLWQACAVTVPAMRVRERFAAVLPGADWSEVFVCDRVGVSPYAALREVAVDRESLPGPVACLTLAGRGLRGQHGRVWCAEPGNLHLSVAMPCDLEAATCGPPLPMLAAVAACEALEDLVGAAAARSAGLAIKWVNDVVLAGGKCGGVLTAMRTCGPRVNIYFAGIAVNLARAPRLEPDPLALPATALASVVAVPPTLGALTGAVLVRLRKRLEALHRDGPEDLVSAYRARSLVLGREVAVWDATVRAPASGADGERVLPQPRRRGVVAAIRPDLSLELAGQAEPVAGGCLRLADSPATGLSGS